MASCIRFVCQIHGKETTVICSFYFCAVPKSQPSLEKRFSHLKTDFEVAPVYLKEVSRIQALLCVYFLALLTESLLERELRRAMDREAIKSLPLYPEGRKCPHPTARRVIDLFEEVQCHWLPVGQRPPMVFTTQLSKLQRRLLRLLGMKDVYDSLVLLR